MDSNNQTIYGSIIKNKNKNNKDSKNENSIIEIKNLKTEEYNTKLKDKYNDARWLTGC